MLARRPFAACLAAAAILAVAAAGAWAEEANAAAGEHFERQIRPLLAAKCWKCHGPDKQEASLRLDSAAAVAAGGDSGPAIAAGDPEHSLLVQAIRRQGDIKMPPDETLDDGQVSLLVAWVKSGAAWPRYPDADQHDAERSSAEALLAAPPANDGDPLWAFRPMGHPQPPIIRAAGEPASPLDRFLIAKAESLGLALRRRLTGGR